MSAGCKPHSLLASPRLSRCHVGACSVAVRCLITAPSTEEGRHYISRPTLLLTTFEPFGRPCLTRWRCHPSAWGVFESPSAFHFIRTDDNQGCTETRTEQKTDTALVLRALDTIHGLAWICPTVSTTDSVFVFFLYSPAFADRSGLSSSTAASGSLC